MKTKNKLLAILTMLLLMAGSKVYSQSCAVYFYYNIDPNNLGVFIDSSYYQGTLVNDGWKVNGLPITSGNAMTYQFPGPGTYDVCRYIETTVCTDSLCETVVINNNCNLIGWIQLDSLNGSLIANVSGGSGPYSYQWNNGANSSNIFVSAPGNYCVTITDAMGCSETSCYNYMGTGCNVVFTYTQIPGTPSYTFIANAPGADSLSWDFGDGNYNIIGWNPTHSYQFSGTFMVCCTTWVAGVACGASCNYLYVNMPATAQLCGIVFDDANGNAVQDAGETGSNWISYGYVYGSGFQAMIYPDSVTGSWSLNVPAGTYTVSLCSYNGSIITVPLPDTSVSCASYQVTIADYDTICGLNFGIYNNSGIISGRVYIDANNNGVYDSGESGVSYQPVTVGTQTYYTDYYGYYNAYVMVGAQVVSYTPTGFYASYNLTGPGTINVNVASQGQVYSGNNFGIALPPGTINLAVTLVPHTTVTPGFPAWYHINITNLGSVPSGGTLEMVYDSHLTLDYASPVQASHNVATRTLTWNVPTINPGMSTTYWVDFNALVSTPLGISAVNFVNLVASAGADINLNNNVDSTHQVTIGSWDPNNKLVVRSNIYNNPNTQTISSLNADQLLKYTINFQNTGTAPAHNVVVLDDMDPLLNASTYQLLSTSHNCLVTRSGHQVTYKFMNIMLPDSFNNEPMSHGHIEYSIEATAGIAAGTVLSDQAGIYFDFNAPVITNLAEVEFMTATFIKNNSALNLQAYPIPADRVAQINFNGDNSMTSLKLFQADGKMVENLLNENIVSGSQTFVLNTEKLSEGLYFVQLSNSSGVKTIKIQVKH